MIRRWPSASSYSWTAWNSPTDSTNLRTRKSSEPGSRMTWPGARRRAPVRIEPGIAIIVFAVVTAPDFREGGVDNRFHIVAAIDIHEPATGEIHGLLRLFRQTRTRRAPGQKH